LHFKKQAPIWLVLSLDTWWVTGGYHREKNIKKFQACFMLGKALSLYGYKINMKFKFKKKIICKYFGYELKTKCRNLAIYTKQRKNSLISVD